MKEDTIRFLVLVSICLAAGLILLNLLYWGFKRLKRPLSDSRNIQGGSGWTVEQINELRKSGRLTDKQYRSLKDAVIRGAGRPAKGSRNRR